MDQEGEEEYAAMEELINKNANEEEQDLDAEAENEESSTQTVTNTLFKSNLINKHLSLNCKYVSNTLFIALATRGEDDMIACALFLESLRMIN